MNFNVPLKPANVFVLSYAQNIVTFLLTTDISSAFFMVVMPYQRPWIFEKMVNDLSIFSRNAKDLSRFV